MNKLMRKPGLTFVILSLLTVVAAGATPGPLAIQRVWPEQIVYQPGATALITVEVSNAAATAQTARVALTIRWGLDGQAELPGQSLTVPARGQATARFEYPVRPDHEWGHEVLATLTDERGAPTTAREYFSVGNDPWKVGHYSTLFGLRGAKESGAIDKQILPKFRERYVTTIEAYSWQPSTFDDLTPATATWRSGQGGYPEGKADWQYLVAQAHKLGMAVVTYFISGSCGPVGMEFVRKHPDWLTYDKDGRPLGAWFDIDMMELQRVDPEKAGCGTFGMVSSGSFLITNPQVGDWFIRQLIGSTAMFGWDGFRSDGNPTIVDGYDYTGTKREAKDLGQANAAYLTKVRHSLRERFPDYRFGWNAVAGGNPFSYPTTQPERDAAFPGSSYILFESFNSVNSPANPDHAWKKLIPYLETEEAAVRHYRIPGHCGWMGSNRYLEAIVSACGSHVDEIGSNPNYRRFEFRWAEFLWDTALGYVRPGDSAVAVTGPPQVWWRDFVHHRDLPGGGQRVIVHLVNMPEKDDDAWADRPPAPATNVKVTFKLPAGKQLKKIGVFSPDTAGDVVAVSAAADGSVTISSVTLWTVVVAEY